MGYGEEAPTQLLAHPQNAKIHPRAQQVALGAAISELGWLAPVIINRQTQHVLDGHARIGLAISRGEKVVPVAYVDLLPEQEALALATFDPIGSLAVHDTEALDALLHDVTTGDAALQVFLTNLAKTNGLEYGGSGLPAGDVPEPQLDRAAELQVKWQTASGQLWLIPSYTVSGKTHRLLCGDSTRGEDVARLMAGERTEMVWTDPPYGVAIGDKNKYLNSIAPSNRVEENLANDTLDESGLVAMLQQAFDHAIAHCSGGAAWYVAAPAGPLHLLFGQVLKERGIWRQTIQWVKNNATFAPLGVDYHWRAEPIFYGWLPNAGHRFYGGRRQDTVWEIDRPSKSPEHPTMKPVALVARAIENSTRAGELVYDPFLGSGTTMAAAEQLGRLCYGCELAPKYVAVVLERMAGMGLEQRREAASS